MDCQSHCVLTAELNCVTGEPDLVAVIEYPRPDDTEPVSPDLPGAGGGVPHIPDKQAPSGHDRLTPMRIIGDALADDSRPDLCCGEPMEFLGRSRSWKRQNHDRRQLGEHGQSTFQG